MADFAVAALQTWRGVIFGIIIDVMRTQLCGVLVAFGLVVTPVFADVTGTVMNADGAPIAGARVLIRAYGRWRHGARGCCREAPEPVTLASTQTDAKGTFKLEVAEGGGGGAAHSRERLCPG